MNCNLTRRKEYGTMNLTEHHTDSDFLFRAENLHKQAEYAWFEGQFDEARRFSEEARALMEKYYCLEVPKLEEEPKRKPISLPRIPTPQPVLEKIAIFALVFLFVCGFLGLIGRSIEKLFN
jgi:hypothetical protein